MNISTVPAKTPFMTARQWRFIRVSVLWIALAVLAGIGIWNGHQQLALMLTWVSGFGYGMSTGVWLQDEKGYLVGIFLFWIALIGSGALGIAVFQIILIGQPFILLYAIGVICMLVTMTTISMRWRRQLR